MAAFPNGLSDLILHLDSLHARIRRNDRLLEEQDKLIQNLIEENERLKPIKPQLVFTKRIKPGRNKSWKASALLGLRELWLTPSRFFEQRGAIAAGGLIVAISATWSVALWIVGRPIILIVGLCGLLREEKEIQR